MFSPSLSFLDISDVTNYEVIESTTPLKHEQWVLKCKNIGKKLASIRNADEQADAEVALNGTSVMKVLTAMHRRKIVGTFVDGEDKPVTYE